MIASQYPVYFLLYFLTGVVGLIYETAWVRLFVIAFGSTSVAVGGVVAAYMLGLAVGGWGGGIGADRSRKSMIRVFAVLELLIMISALLVPVAIRSLGPAGGNSIMAQPVRFILCLAVISLPTALMGATYPVLVRAISNSAEVLGKLAGKLYAINVLGAAAGCFVAGFFLLPKLGLQNTIFLGALLNLLIVIGTLMIRPKQEESPSSRTVTDKNDDRRLLLPLLVALGTGFSGISYQVIYTRVLALIVHNTVYAFSSILTVFLLGTFLGSHMASSLAGREHGRWRSLGIVEIAIALYAMVSIPMVSSLADWFLELNYGQQVFGESFFAFLCGQFVLTIAFVLIPSFLLGFAFPLCVGIYHGKSDSANAGRSAGGIYAINTFGSMVGAAACGFLIIPHLGTRNALLLACAVNLLLGISAILADREMERKNRQGAVALVIFIALFLSPLTHYDLTFTHLATGPEREVVFSEEDAMSLIEVFRERTSGVLSLISNRQQQEGSTSRLSLYSQKKQGYLPLLLHPAPEKVLGIGLGTGISYRPWTLFPLKLAEIVEISPGVIHAANVFKAYNENITHRSDIKVIFSDGRNALKTGSVLYDLIVADLFSPYREGTGNLYTLEHYRRCRRRLQQGGMMWQWLPPHQLAYPALTSIIKSFTTVFPHSTLWVTRQSMALQGGLKPLSISWPQLVKRIQNPAIRADLAADNLDDPMEFLSLFFAGEDALKKISASSPENTEDNGLVEFLTPRYLHLLMDEKLYFSNLEKLLPYKKSIKPYLTGWEGDFALLERREAAKTHVYRAKIFRAAGNLIRAEQEFSRALELHPSEMEAQRR